MHLAHFVALAGVIEHALGRGRLAGINVRHDAEVAIVLDGMGAGHGGKSFAVAGLPAIVRECAVGFSHPVRVLALLDRVPPVIRRIEQLAREPLGHCLFVALARRGDDPADACLLYTRCV